MALPSERPRSSTVSSVTSKFAALQLRTPLYKCKVYTSTISDSTLDSCTVFNSTFEACCAIDSKIHECKFAKLKITRCAVSTSPLAFRKFPPEIREMIFKGCLEVVDRKTPILLVALRGDLELYQEAIKLFKRVTAFQLDKKMCARFKTLSDSALSNISMLEIE
jgi:hypothetical protein